MTHLKSEAEYIFFFPSYICTGFFVGSKDGMVHLKNGYFFFKENINFDEEAAFPYKEASFDIAHIVGYATT